MFRVDVSIAYGNACDVSVYERDGTPEIAFTADPRGDPECLWFCLRVFREGPDTAGGSKMRLVLKHFQNMLGLSAAKADKVLPVARYDGGE